MEMIENKHVHERYADCYIEVASDDEAAGEKSGQPR
jgi:hypothetical protein